jgi:DNA-directed RNA polymerase subunit RPC12/RpoP
MTRSFSFRCSACNAPLKAPVELIDHSRRCPVCRKRIMVRPRPPQEAGPMLVPFERPAPTRLRAG